MNSLIGFAVLISLSIPSVLSNYCDANICRFNVRIGNYIGTEYKRHIACGNSLAYQNVFGPSCYQHKIIPMTTDFINLILRKHNTLRADTANGRIPGYLTANQMSELTWDSELAYLAEINAKSCTYGHDDCRNTASYRFVGQNIALNWYSVGYPRQYMLSAESFASYYIDQWFNEYRDASMNDIYRFRSIRNSKGQMIGHFTQMVKSDANRVGCAITTYVNRYASNSFNYYLVCNYNLENIEEKSTYYVGPPCSACRTGCSAEYPGLCSRNEITKVNFP
ncbi:hypothetical protein HA402_001185 [Bradysia odoriphaga]|nr:hypothetical protein HA402_001185 [Bradysia odoriphaga]